MAIIDRNRLTGPATASTVVIRLAGSKDSKDAPETPHEELATIVVARESS